MKCMVKRRHPSGHLHEEFIKWSIPRSHLLTTKQTGPNYVGSISKYASLGSPQQENGDMGVALFKLELEPSPSGTDSTTKFRAR